MAIGCHAKRENTRESLRPDCLDGVAGKGVPVLIDVDKQPELAAKYGVNALPTVIFLNAKGQLIRKEVGYHDTDEFLKLTDEVLKQVSAGKKDAQGVAQK